MYDDVQDAIYIFFLLNIRNIKQVNFLFVLLSCPTFVSSSHLHELFLATSCPPWPCPCCARKPVCCPSTLLLRSSRYEHKAWRGVAYRKPLKPDPSWWKIDVNVQTSTTSLSWSHDRHRCNFGRSLASSSHAPSQLKQKLKVFHSSNLNFYLGFSFSNCLHYATPLSWGPFSQRYLTCVASNEVRPPTLEAWDTANCTSFALQRCSWWAACSAINYVVGKDLRVKKEVIKIHPGYELLIWFP